MMKRKYAGIGGVGLVAALVATTAVADIIPIDPFSGDFSEDFESFPNYNNGGNTDTLAIAGDAADFSSNPANTFQLWVIEPNAGATWGLGGDRGAATTLGEKALGLFSNGAIVDVVLDLDTPASAFGFYYVSGDGNDGDTTLNVSFFDEDGNQLGAEQALDSGDGSNTYVWAGWSSETGIAKVIFTGNRWPVMDDIQFNSIPAPGALALLGIAGLTARRRRRN